MMLSATARPVIRKLGKSFLSHYFLIFCSLLLLPGALSHAQETTAEQQAKLSNIQGGDTISQLTELQQKNKYAQLRYSVAAVKLAQEGASNFTHGGECKLSCPFGCCDSSDGLIYQGGVYMLLNSQATMQSRTHQLVAKQACETSNKYAVTPQNCAAEVKPFDVTKPDANWMDEKGKCKPNAPADCIILSLIPGSSVFGTKGVNCKKSSVPCADDFFSTYKSNPDGSLTIKTSPAKSVKLSIESFKSLESLLAAGVPAEIAESLLSQFSKIQKKVIGNIGTGQMAASRPPQKFEPDKSLKGSELTETTQSRGAAEAAGNSEKPVRGDSLTKNFRGEAIHIWSANIFEVMSNRYQKTSGSLLP